MRVGGRVNRVGVEIWQDTRINVCSGIGDDCEASHSTSVFVSVNVSKGSRPPSPVP